MGTLSLLGAGPGKRLVTAPPFVPTDLAGLQAWYKADVGVYTTDAMTTPATADLDPVGGWQDQSGSSRHLKQTNAAKRPVLKLAIQNGRNVVRFDGVDDFMDAASAVLSASVFTAFLVHRTTGDNIWGSTVAAANHQFRLGQSGFNLSLFDAATNPNSTASAASRASWTQACYQNGSPPHFWINGVNLDNGGNANNMTLQRFFIDFGGTAAPVNGDVGEIVIYNTLLNTTDRQNVENYLQARWAL